MDRSMESNCTPAPPPYSTLGPENLRGWILGGIFPFHVQGKVLHQTLNLQSVKNLYFYTECCSSKLPSLFSLWSCGSGFGIGKKNILICSLVTQQQSIAFISVVLGGHCLFLLFSGGHCLLSLNVAENRDYCRKGAHAIYHIFPFRRVQESFNRYETGLTNWSCAHWSRSG